MPTGFWYWPAMASDAIRVWSPTSMRACMIFASCSLGVLRRRGARMGHHGRDLAAQGLLVKLEGLFGLSIECEIANQLHSRLLDLDLPSGLLQLRPHRLFMRRLFGRQHIRGKSSVSNTWRSSKTPSLPSIGPGHFNAH